jgi:serine/threonine-protein kinase
MAVRTELGAGTRVASYTLSSVLGRGAMGVVYEADDERLERRVALKVLAPSRGESARFRDRFLRESRLAASLDHPNVIPIYEAGDADGLLFIAMRLVVGTDLRGLLVAEGPLAPERALRIVEQAGSALDAAHAAGLLHRDVKPGNILLASDQTAPEHVYLSDFGLAVSGAAEDAHERGSFHGTAEYAAPEQIEGRPESSSDIYSLACVLFECLAGEPPFGRRRLLETLWSHLNEEPPRLSDRLPGSPPAADAVFAAALAKAPSARPSSSADLVAAVRAAFGLDRTTRPRGRAVVAAVAAGAVAAVLAVAAATGVIGADSAAEGSAAISTFAGTGERGSGGDGGPAVEAQLADPISAAVDRSGSVYVGEEASHRVRRIGLDGTITTVAGPDGLTTPIDLQVGPDGSLYILEHDRPAVRRIDGRGRIVRVAGTGEAGFLDDGPRTLSRDLCARPVGLALDADGVVHVACPSAHRVVRVERDGTLTTVAGSGEPGFSGDGGRALAAALNGP